MLRVSENRMPRRILGSKSNEVTRGWRKLHRGLSSIILFSKIGRAHV
jgi:hypothetical protein